MMPIEPVLVEIRQEQQAAGEVVRPGAAPAEIAAAEAQVRAQLGATLPPDYAAFLAIRNGVDYNGLVLYGALDTPAHPGPGGFWQGLVAANKAWRSESGNEQLLILGDSDMDLYAVPTDGGAPGKFDRVTGERVESYPDVATMIEAVLRERL